MKRKHPETVNESENDTPSQAADDEPSEMLLQEEGAIAGEGAANENASSEPDVNEALAEALEATRDQILRLRAEFDNFRKRVARDAEKTRKMAAESLIKDLLPVADNFERALQHGQGDTASLLEGIAMVHKQFVDVLSRHGVEAISAIGEPFDPNVHDALSRMPSDEHAEDKVALEYEKGYRLGDVVLRPAKVVVRSGPAED